MLPTSPATARANANPGLPQFVAKASSPPQPVGDSKCLTEVSEEVRERKSIQRISPDIALAETYGAQLIPDLKEYAKDSDDRVAYTAFSILSAISHRSEHLETGHLYPQRTPNLCRELYKPASHLLAVVLPPTHWK